MNKKPVFAILTGLILVAVFALLIRLFLPRFKDSLHDQLVQAVMFTLSQEERDSIYRQIVDIGSDIWDVVPDPLVARLAKRDLVVTYVQAEVRTNNAGLRSSRPFEKKAPDVFRIVCLGDSFVFGQGGLEEDRFCDQIEAFYRGKGITAEGKTIETYAVGLGGWTAVQEAAYLSSRLSAYEPDIILVLTVGNDITDNQGVTGTGATTHGFSPEHRDWGSGTFSDRAGMMFGMARQTALSTDIGPEARARWRKAMGALRRLSEVQVRRGGKILNSVSLRNNAKSAYFVETYKHFYSEHGPATPFVITSYFRSDETRLPHNAHPNRRGHSIFAHHYIHMLDQLGWLDVPRADLPPLDPRLSLETNPAPDPDLLQKQRQKFIDSHLRPSIRFAPLKEWQTMAFLGGILPDVLGAEARKSAPWASVRSGFLLRPKKPREEAQVTVEIRVPPRPELFPFRVQMFLNGELTETFEYPEPGEWDRYELTASIEAPGEVVEVVLRTESYFSEIEDHRMKSFQLIRATIR